MFCGVQLLKKYSTLEQVTLVQNTQERLYSSPLLYVCNLINLTARRECCPIVSSHTFSILICPCLFLCSCSFGFENVKSWPKYD